MANKVPLFDNLGSNNALIWPSSPPTNIWFKKWCHKTSVIAKSNRGVLQYSERSSTFKNNNSVGFSILYPSLKWWFAVTSKVSS